MLAQSLYLFLFIQIMIHIQSNMLKKLIEILKEAAEENLSKFVKRPMFSEEVVSDGLEVTEAAHFKMSFMLVFRYLSL